MTELLTKVCAHNIYGEIYHRDKGKEPLGDRLLLYDGLMERNVGCGLARVWMGNQCPVLSASSLSSLLMVPLIVE